MVWARNHECVDTTCLNLELTNVTDTTDNPVKIKTRTPTKIHRLKIITL
jgi:hypothetical protein